ncbi:MAG: histidine--tRNA ligase [Candidatus Blackburnbacteria bacterium RIFCSPHIGHO2_01_FULL_44_64]|uniref:Histidine--tRNA ligase n=1 Tax=Candidatus Blackburnbacteria bacterium RIFCSPHIGHO2_02_FULL_44_20 TaxID=1797516 RepID=A0A1G1V8F0_9BACT|nr:MAG: histidine--tRNA ligase [Candidatus Blackburnbacteria bacterium RIFCSPHIGHO2_01_FULL_44_64]OGY11185.1 MAG: histidine--tRNA ligase [Candidatus Blackburnbacteria bacterium RIFCSPHIGHO2_12_FULL_44_25]OGY11472.1 MAG: histidine--tRNA ligase [Candidatus Blackburnbacteria bacterium RIFCSPHIGHO2_02_FULL_44_20]
MNKPQTLKGFRDFLPQEARKREYVIDILKGVFQLYGFEPLETPALEYEEILMGKYGEEGNKLMYRFEDNGKRRVALRYDQTVPLARVVAQYGQELPSPFRRYQIQPVWRAENTQRGRYREFLQCDIDITGVDSPLADAEIIACALTGVQKLGFEKLTMNINDRMLFEGIDSTYLTVIDKLPKIGEEAAKQELVERGMEDTEVDAFLAKFSQMIPSENLEKLFEYLEKMGFVKDKDFTFNPLVVRGLDYYTSTIFELVDSENPSLSLAGGGRYDNLIGIFAGSTIPATGLAFGFDRLIETMEAKSLFPKDINAATPQVLVSIFSPEFSEESVKVSSRLRKSRINTELYPDETVKMEKQLKYADKRGIQYVVIIGPEEVKNNQVTVKDLQSGEQKTLDQEELLRQFT